jgi:hypothetical protein
MRAHALPLFALLPLSAALPPPAIRTGTVEIRATCTESPRAPGADGWSKTWTWTAHAACTVSEGPGGLLANMPGAAADMVPGVAALWTFTPDKAQEPTHSGTYKYVEVSGIAITTSEEGALIGPFSGSVGLAAGIHQDDLVATPASVLTGFFKGTTLQDGRPVEFREAEGILIVPGDLANPMDPEMPRPVFSMKAFQASMAGGKPFTLSSSKTYELDLKDKHYKGSFTLALTVNP